MHNPLAIAFKGKGLLPTLARSRAITRSYGFTASKMESALTQMTDILNQFGCNATIPITADVLMRHPNVAQKFREQGLELAVHGLRHIDYQQLRDLDQQNEFRKARDIFEHVGIHATGFRCPYLRWNIDTLSALRECGFDYDSSQALALDVVDGLETGAYQRALEFYGAQRSSEIPALPRLVNGLVRIPYCLPDDEALVERMHRNNRDSMAEIWITMLEYIHQTGELFTLGLHPERISLCQEALRAVLEKGRLLTPPVWIATLDEIASWYRALGQTTFDIRMEDGDRFRMNIQAPSRATILVRSLEVETQTEPWRDGYQYIPVSEFVVRSHKRPLVGISPECPTSVADFLRHQGYLIEVSTDDRGFAFYLRRPEFCPQDERALLTEIEGGDWPVVRLARWPAEAQCGLSITGDVDALTLWDFGHRLWNQ